MPEPDGTNNRAAAAVVELTDNYDTIMLLVDLRRALSSEHCRVKSLRQPMLFACLLAILAGFMPCFGQGASGPLAPGPDTIPFVRFEVLPVANGAELLTLFFQEQPAYGSPWGEVPLISVLRDTLGNSDPQVHRLRYLWVHTSATPSMRQRLAAATPFMYSRFGNAGTGQARVPASVMDLSKQRGRFWKSTWEFVHKGAVLDPKVSLLDSVVRTYVQNRSSYMQTQFARASTALDMGDRYADLTMLSDKERRQLQAGLAQRTKALANLLNEDQLERLSLKEMIAMRQACAHNWELLRQRAESEGLYFEPLLLPDGTATHALLLVAKQDIETKYRAHFDDRFLSISKPWGDKVLLDWSGATETRYFDAENRPVAAGQDGARRVELIPLALYGLDHPKIPALLIDFRKPLNAKRRELSSRAANELGARLFGGSGLLSRMLAVGRTTVGILSRRTGVDLFQPSRALSYSRLKMVLSVNPGLGDEMRMEIARRVEYVAVNPLENDVETEIALAQNQYEALVEYAGRPDGLRVDLDRDRRAELTATTHGGGARFLFRLGDVLTFGLYTHREHQRPDLELLLEAQRRNLSQFAFLREVAKSGIHMDVEWDLVRVRNALRDIVSGKSPSDAALADTTFRIFAQSRDNETRQLCLDTLHRFDTSPSRDKLLKIAQDQSLDMKWRLASATYLGISIAPQGVPAPSGDRVTARLAASND